MKGVLVFGLKLFKIKRNNHKRLNKIFRNHKILFVNFIINLYTSSECSSLLYEPKQETQKNEKNLFPASIKASPPF